MSGEKIVFWKSKLTGKEGHGKPLLPSIADAWVTYGNEEFPDIIHIAVETKIEKGPYRGHNQIGFGKGDGIIPG